MHGSAPGSRGSADSKSGDWNGPETLHCNKLPDEAVAAAPQTQSGYSDSQGHKRTASQRLFPSVCPPAFPPSLGICGLLWSLDCLCCAQSPGVAPVTHDTRVLALSRNCNQDTRASCEGTLVSTSKYRLWSHSHLKGLIQVLLLNRNRSLLERHPGKYSIYFLVKSPLPSKGRAEQACGNSCGDP